jgi:hypothetical protein
MPKSQYLADLTMKIGADTAQLRKGLDKAKGRVKNFQGNVKQASKNIQNSFQSMSSGLASSMSPQLAMITGGFSKLASTIKTSVIPSIAGMGVALTVATGGIILVLGAIVAAFVAVQQWISRTVDGTERWSLVVAKMEGYWNAIMDRVALVGKFIYEAFTEGFGTAIDNFKKGKAELLSMSEVSEEMVKLQERKNALWRKERKDLEEISRLTAEIARQREIAYDTEKDTDVRLKAINEALRLAKIQEQMKVELAKERLAIAEKEASLGKNNKETEEELTRLRVAVNEAEAARSKMMTRLLTYKGTLVNLTAKEQKDLEKNVTAERERNDELLKRLEILSGRGKDEGIKKKASDSPFIPDDSAADETLSKELDRIATLQGAKDEAADREKERIADTESYKQSLISAGFATTRNMLGAVAAMQSANMQRELKAAEGNEAKQEEIRKKYAKKRKAMSIANVVVSGAEGIAKTIAQWGMPLAVPFIAMTAATTAMQIAAISAQKYAMGGVSKGGMAMVGERGKELVHMPEGSRVYSNHDTQKMLGSTSGGGGVFIPDVRLEGEDIYISFKEAERKRNNTR